MTTGNAQRSASDPTRVLLVEDNSGDARLIRYLLRQVTNQTHTFEETGSLAQAFEAARKNSFDVVLLDLSLPDSSGLETVTQAQEHLDHLPIIVMTGSNDDALAIRAVQAGAQDYIRKGETDGISLFRCIRYAVERKRSEHLLAERNAALVETNDNLRQLTFALTHDLQTPLASLVGAVNAFRRHAKVDLAEEPTRWLDRIETSTSRMTRMLDELMMFARANSDQLKCEAVPLPDMLTEIIQELTSAGMTNGVSIEVDMSELEVWANRDALYRALQNVIANAIKHNHRSDQRLVNIEAVENAGRIIIRVTDNGPGIPEHQLKRVFLPFTRVSADPSGTGLGLAIVRSHIERMGGRVWLESDGANGTTMLIDLASATTSAASPNLQAVAA